MKLTLEQQRSIEDEWQKYQKAIAAQVELNEKQTRRYAQLEAYFGKVLKRYEELVGLIIEKDDDVLPAPYPPASHLMFADDYPELYSSGILPQPTATGFQSFVQPSQDASFNAVAPVSDDFISVPRRVKIARQGSASVRGIVDQFANGDLDIVVKQDSEREERIPASDIAWISVYRPTGAQALPLPDVKYRVTFPDGRKMVGASSDYDADSQFFSFIMPAGKSQYERLIINASFLSDFEPI